jgi:2-keto-4-pentenoate hydratase/2-oxohepta-3-ene-1,7-dioic acid hydratase in catechol pathway
MRIIRFLSGNQIHFGTPVGQTQARSARRIEGNLFDSFKVTDEELPIDRLLAPLVPTDILCIGLNYQEHAAEGNFIVPDNPMLFIKAGNTLNDPGASIPIPKRSSEIDYEGELVVIIGKAAKDVSRADALKHVFGYTIGNDVTARDWQREKSLGGGQFARGKSFDGFLPLGPAIVTADEIPNPQTLQVTTTLNGQVMQNDNTASMIYDIPALIESLSSTMTLRPGAIICTGTPSGVGFARKPPVWLKSGDRIWVDIEPIGRLENRVA